MSRPSYDEADVVVVGAGLAGLRCAGDLAGAGLQVVVLESADVVGGRVRTDAVDGFLVDRGFQLLNPAYPALADLDIASLELQAFGAGVAARREDGLVRLADPRRAPRLLPQTLRFLAQEPGDVVALARWARPLLHRQRGLAEHLHESVEAGRLAPSLAGSWDAAGLDGSLRRILERFLAGVLLEEEGNSPADLALLLVSSFLRGTPSLPADGMRALSALVARTVPDVRLSTTVTGLGGDGTTRTVHTDAGSWRARAVVVATDASVAATLLDAPAAPMRGVVTAWFAVGDQPAPTRLLHVDARQRPAGPVVNTAVVSDVAPTYAPAGRRLVQASAVLTDPSSPPTVAAIRQHAAELLGCDPGTWEEVAVHHVPHALPETGSRLVVRQPVHVDPGLYVCGDHRDTPSIQGALVSGRRTARLVAAELASGRQSETA